MEVAEGWLPKAAPLDVPRGAGLPPLGGAAGPSHPRTPVAMVGCSVPVASSAPLPVPQPSSLSASFGTTPPGLASSSPRVNGSLRASSVGVSKKSSRGVGSTVRADTACQRFLWRKDQNFASRARRERIPLDFGSGSAAVAAGMSSCRPPGQAVELLRGQGQRAHRDLLTPAFPDCARVAGSAEILPRSQATPVGQGVPRGGPANYLPAFTWDKHAPTARASSLWISC